MVLIRLARPDDAGAIADVYRPYVEGSRISFEEQAPDAAELARRIIGDRPGFHPWLVAEENGRILGFSSSSPFRTRRAYRWSAETGIYLAADASGRAVASAIANEPVPAPTSAAVPSRGRAATTSASRAGL